MGGPTRREFLKTVGFAAVSAPAISAGGSLKAAGFADGFSKVDHPQAILAAAVRGEPRKSRPGVILIMTDDQGYGDLGCHGNDVIVTPNLDELHAKSIRLTDFHVDPTCSPTRSALMTGHYSSRTGVWHTIMGRSILRSAGAPPGYTIVEVGSGEMRFRERVAAGGTGPVWHTVGLGRRLRTAL